MHVPVSRVCHVPESVCTHGSVYVYACVCTRAAYIGTYVGIVNGGSACYSMVGDLGVSWHGMVSRRAVS